MAGLSKRADGRYCVKVATGDGPKFVYGKSQKEVREKERALRERLRSGGPVRDSRRTLGSWLDEWSRTNLKLSNRAESTKIMHAGYCRVWIIPLLGTVPLNRITPNDVNRLILAMVDAELSTSTVRNAYTALRKALDDAVAVGLLASNPVHKVKQPQAARSEARYLTPDEAKAFLRSTGQRRYAEILKLILLTGLRRGEALALRWTDLDLENGHAQVNGSLVRQGGALVVVAPKTRCSRRTIALSGAAVALLRTRKATQAVERLRAGNLWNASNLVFTTEFGKPVEPQNLLRLTRDASSLAGLQGVKVHTLRHTYATTALLAGVPLKVVSDNLGHASIQITADTYGHVTDEAARAAARAVSDAYAFGDELLEGGAGD